ncbi:nuclear transport factor 2 family protein [Amycolatopsis methanolica]|uniref:nuclear transport factor 2 family protein n=1 Tax=Amycolatopsis methanolica TaxID=1814 RepID=UPI00036999A6|nr:nuclear transport factor 2 family protein [Amycolatopsis methanolica]
MTAFENRVEIEALRGDFTDAGMVRDYDRFASLFTADGRWCIPPVADFTGPGEIRAGIERLQAHWEFFVQTAHPGVIRIDGDTATGRAYIAEFGRFRDGSSHANHAIYHDRYRRTPDGWRFTERVYEMRYVDETPLLGKISSAPGSAPGGAASSG